MIGTKVLVTHKTATGTQTTFGHVVTPMMIEEIEGQEIVTHITVEGQVIATKINGLPGVIEEERAVRFEMIPVESRHHLIEVEILE